MVNFGTKHGGGGIKPPPAPSKTEGKSLFKSITVAGVYLITILLALSVAVTVIASYQLRDVAKSLASIHQILDTNGIIDTQEYKSPVRFIVVVENGNVVGMYESKVGVISTIQTNQFEVLRK